jgi:hypothetical protein
MEDIARAKYIAEDALAEFDSLERKVADAVAGLPRA